MYPFWKGRPGNINLVSVRVFDFVHLERRADVAGRHRLQTRAPWAGVPAQVTLSKSLNLSAKCQQQHPPRKFPVRIKWGKCHEAPRAGSDGLLHPNLFLRVLPGLEKLRGVVAELEQRQVIFLAVLPFLHMRIENEAIKSNGRGSLWSQTCAFNTSRLQFPLPSNGLLTVSTS